MKTVKAITARAWAVLDRDENDEYRPLNQFYQTAMDHYEIYHSYRSAVDASGNGRAGVVQVEIRELKPPKPRRKP
jgi:hypothetical protein